jgi:hypothetical protein
MEGRVVVDGRKDSLRCVRLGATPSLMECRCQGGGIEGREAVALRSAKRHSLCDVSSRRQKVSTLMDDRELRRGVFGEVNRNLVDADE